MHPLITRRRKRRERPQSLVGGIEFIQKEAALQLIVRSHIELTSQQVIAGPLRRGVGTPRQIFKKREVVLDGGAVREPCATSLDRPGKCHSRIPVAEMQTLLRTYSWDKLGDASAKSVLSYRRIERQYAGSGMGVF